MQLKREESRQTRVILVRHGQSTYNALGLYQGSSDKSVLTELGRSDARKTGSFLQELAFDAMYASSLKRAQETAREILGVMAPQVDPSGIFVTDKLRETDMPAWQGLAFQYVRENFPLEYRFWKQCPHQFWMNPITELDSLLLGFGLGQRSHLCIYPVLSLYQRVQEFWQEVLPHYVGKTLLLVTHSGTNRALISTALGITPDRYHCIQQSNCGISVLNFADGSLESGQLEVMNLSSHVGEYLPKPQEGGKGLRLVLIASNIAVEKIHNLAELLKEISIKFSLSSVSNNSHEIAEQILQYHPETCNFKVLHEDYPQDWQIVINAKTGSDPDNLTTGLVVANEQTIKYLICQAIGMNLEQIERLQIKKGTISCIQYPGSHHPPILQAMNISKALTLYDATLRETNLYSNSVRSRLGEAEQNPTQKSSSKS